MFVCHTYATWATCISNASKRVRLGRPFDEDWNSAFTFFIQPRYLQDYLQYPSRRVQENNYMTKRRNAQTHTIQLLPLGKKSNRQDYRMVSSARRLVESSKDESSSAGQVSVEESNGGKCKRRGRSKLGPTTDDPLPLSLLGWESESGRGRSNTWLPDSIDFGFLSRLGIHRPVVTGTGEEATLGAILILSRL